MNQLTKVGFLLIVGIALGACGGARQTEKREMSGNSNNESPAAANQIKVLVQERYTGVLAADGMLFLTGQIIAEVNDEVKQWTTLDSGDGLTVVGENMLEFKSPVDKKPLTSPQPWKHDPKDFDFLLEWDKDWNEHKKASMLGQFQATVKESIKLVKVSDPNVTKNWSYTYNVKGDIFGSNKKTDEIALEQVKLVVGPARKPVLKEIRDFISANSAK